MLSFSRNKWEAYAGMSQDDAFDILKKVLAESALDYETSKAPPLYMYDSEHEQIIVRTSGMTFSLIYVTADPLTRLFSSMLGTRHHLSAITLISVTHKKESRRLLADVMHRFVAASPKVPWNIRECPRFQFAVLLQLINKWKWKNMCMANSG